MSEQTNETANQDQQYKALRILQINLNKSEKAHLDIINEKVSQNYDIILIQEPHTTAFNAIRTPTNFRPVFPTNRFKDDSQIRSVIWVNKQLETKDWTIIDIPNTNDITAIKLKGLYGTISIFNIYNDCTHSRNEAILQNYLNAHFNDLSGAEDAHMIWAGDFNRHHPLWDDDRDTHLFTNQALKNAEGIIALLAEHDMAMALPKGIPTLRHMRTKKYSRPDNIFCSLNLQPFITQCEVSAEARPTATDHFPIETHFDLPQSRIPPDSSHNFRDADWEAFKKTLTAKLNLATKPTPITNAQQLNILGDEITLAIQETIETEIKSSRPRPDSKRWWNSDLTKRRKELNRLRATSYKYRAITHHNSHSELRRKSNQYGDEIIKAKRKHWANYLEEMSANDIWTANKYLKDPIGDGGSPRIPTLRTKDEHGNEVETNDNENKAKIFAKTFFPPPPEQDANEILQEYPEPLPDPPQPDRNQIERIISNLSPYKATGPDGIPNIVLQKCFELIADHLLYIYQAILTLGIYYDPWKEFTTIVIKKPNKPNYTTPKAYRPIALISTMAKVLTAAVAENISRLVEQHQLLPNTHFGGRPGRTTTDAIHYLVHKLKTAWANNQVASVLFLDVEGAFPNAVNSRLIHNLKKRRIPATYVGFVTQLLSNRKTRIKFDDYISGPHNISNGIGQGDPLSMILYIIYNADLLEIPGDETKEDAIGYVDDIALIAVGDNFEETTNRLKSMMEKEDGGLQWSMLHNSQFEISKSAVLHATRKTETDPADGTKGPPYKPPLVIDGLTIQEVEVYKYLGIQIDNQLRWKEQTQRAVANATKWLLQYRRLTRPSTGTGARLMRQLYVAVALPKITYGLDVWYTPPYKPAGHSKNSGSAGALRQLQKVQRIATTAITGALRTTPTDLIDAHAGTLPIELALLKAVHRAAIRMLTLPPTHPLYEIITSTRLHPPSRHASPIANLFKILKLERPKVETIIPKAQHKNRAPKFSTKIAASREDSIKDEKNDDAEFRAYSDGSGTDEGIGAAAVLYKRGRTRPIDQLKLYLGPPASHNTYEAETAGAILATWLISKRNDIVGKKVSLYIDNQSVITVIKNPTAKSGQYLVHQLNLLANALTCKLGIKWISSHSEVKGNEKADSLAKKAATGRSSRRTDLPPTFRSTLPDSASASKQDYLAKLKGKWSTKWSSSDRRLRMAQFDDNFPFNDFRKRSYTLSRNQASLMMQIRSGHFPLNSYLHKIGKSDTDLCPACEDHENGIRRRETANHLVFECPAYNQERETMLEKIKRRHFNFLDIMSNTDHMKTLAIFINSTGRLKKPTI
jgi:ribonuclease HI